MAAWKIFRVRRDRATDGGCCLRPAADKAGDGAPRRPGGHIFYAHSNANCNSHRDADKHADANQDAHVYADGDAFADSDIHADGYAD
jgi:hypothetical protein